MVETPQCRSSEESTPHPAKHLALPVYLSHSLAHFRKDPEDPGAQWVRSKETE